LDSFAITVGSDGSAIRSREIGSDEGQAERIAQEEPGMTGRRQAFFIAALIAILLPMSAMSNDVLSGKSSPLCLVPVKNGEPIKDDLYSAFRMVSKAVVVPGLDRAIIFPWNRDGVWTIDAAGAYVPFGGDFPNQYLDEYAFDASTGDVIGVSWKLGVFRLRPGETRFDRLYAADGKPFVHPYSTAYVARFGGTVISDNSGLYLLRSSGQVERLHWDARVGGTTVGRVFDLPELHLLLFAAPGHIYARDDKGKLTIFDKGFGGLEAARVTADGSIFLKRYGQNLIVRWPPEDLARPAALQGTHTEENFEDVETHLGSLVKAHEKKMSVPLPANVYGAPVEFPGGIIVADAGEHGLYMLNAENRWDFVDHSREIAATINNLYRLPIENHALLVSGKKRLFLLVRKTDPRSLDCLK
jgi:hypothetical protein